MLFSDSDSDSDPPPRRRGAAAAAPTSPAARAKRDGKSKGAAERDPGLPASARPGGGGPARVDNLLGRLGIRTLQGSFGDEEEDSAEAGLSDAGRAATKLVSSSSDDDEELRERIARRKPCAKTGTASQGERKENEKDEHAEQQVRRHPQEVQNPPLSWRPSWTSSSTSQDATQPASQFSASVNVPDSQQSLLSSLAPLTSRPPPAARVAKRRIETEVKVGTDVMQDLKKVNARTKRRRERGLEKLRASRSRPTELPFFEKPLFVGTDEDVYLGVMHPSLASTGARARYAHLTKEEPADGAGNSKTPPNRVAAMESNRYNLLWENRRRQDRRFREIQALRKRGLEGFSLKDIALANIAREPRLLQALKEGTGPFELWAGTLEQEKKLGRIEELGKLPKCNGDQGAEKFWIPRRVARYLNPYQVSGVQFLFDIFSGLAQPWDVVRGGVLADEMGLGKTIQVLAFLSAILRKTGQERIDHDAIQQRNVDKSAKERFIAEGGPVLIVLPVSVLDNWASELEKWGHFDTESLRSNPEKTVDRLVNHTPPEVVLCGYEKMTELMAHDDRFAALSWRAVVFDEVHRVKNDSTKRAKAARMLRSRCKIGLTGTPLSNRVEEVWGILNVVCPETFGPKQNFWKSFGAPITRGRKQGATRRDIEMQEKFREELNGTLNRVMLRRCKVVIEHKLEGKQDTMVLCPLTALQERVYLTALQSPDFVKAIAACISDKTVGWPTPQQDEGLYIPANDIADLEKNTDNDTELPIWRLQHRFPKRWAFRKKQKGGDERGDDELDPIAGVSKGVEESAEDDPNAGANDNEDEEEGEEEDAAGASRDKRRNNKGLIVRSAKHDSSESDTDEELDDHGSAIRKFKLCGSCERGNMCVNMPLLMILAKIANHLELVRVDPSLGKHEKRAKLRLAKLLLGPDGARPSTGDKFDTEPDDAAFMQSKRFKDLVDPSQCGKLRVLKQLLKRWREKGGIKVLIFSNSLVLLDVLESYTKKLGYPVMRLDGSTPNGDRQNMCVQFNQDPGSFVFLMSTRAGGEGLNLTGASKVVIFDPAWNPSQDLQAQDRAYRLGQRRFVQVYRLISQGTIEENKFLRQVDKQQLSRTVLDQSVEKRLFNDNELEGMIELLRYSRKSFSAQITERYQSQRQAYVKASKQANLAGGMARFTEHEDSVDCKKDDDFKMLDVRGGVGPSDQQSGSGKDQGADGDLIKENYNSVNWTEMVGNSTEEMAFQSSTMDQSN